MRKTKKILSISLGIIILGIILAVTGFFMGGKAELIKGISGYEVFDSKDKELINEQTEAFKNIEIDSNVNSIEIIKSDKYAIEMQYQKDNDNVSYSIKDGKLSIKQMKKKNLEILSKLTIGKTEMSKYIKVYIPSDASLDSMNIKSSFADISMNDIDSSEIFIYSDYGNVNAKNINNNTFNIDMENGNINLDNIKSNNVSKIKNEYGNIDIKNSEFKNLNHEINNGELKIENTNIDNSIIDNEYGNIKLNNVKTNGLKIDGENSNIELEGEFSGDTNIECDYGNVEIRTNIEKTLYNYNFNCEYGNIKVNEEKFSNNINSNGNNPNNMKIKSENGDIKVNFK